MFLSYSQIHRISAYVKKWLSRKTELITSVHLFLFELVVCYLIFLSFSNSTPLMLGFSLIWSVCMLFYIPNFLLFFSNSDPSISRLNSNVISLYFVTSDWGKWVARNFSWYLSVDIDSFKSIFYQCLRSVLFSREVHWESQFSPAFWYPREILVLTLLNGDNYSSWPTYYDYCTICHKFGFVDGTISTQASSSLNHTMCVSCKHRVLFMVTQFIRTWSKGEYYILRHHGRVWNDLRNCFLNVVVYGFSNYNMRSLIFIRIIFSLSLITLRWKRVGILYWMLPTYPLVQVVLQRVFFFTTNIISSIPYGIDESYFIVRSKMLLINPCQQLITLIVCYSKNRNIMRPLSCLWVLP